MNFDTGSILTINPSVLSLRGFKKHVLIKILALKKAFRCAKPKKMRSFNHYKY